LPESRSLKARALFYLSRREYSRVELMRKLSTYAESQEQLEALLDELEQASWLSSERFTESLLRRQAGRFGSARLLQQLKVHQIDDALLDNVRTHLAESECARAQAVWEKKFRNALIPQADAQAYAKSRAKQIRFLLMRGFSVELATKIVDQGMLDKA
jgi:regulatory protein